MAIKNIDVTNEFGVVKGDGIFFKNLEEKPITTVNINAGIYVLNTKVIKNIRSDVANKLFEKYIKAPYSFHMVRWIFQRPGSWGECDIRDGTSDLFCVGGHFALE